MIFYRFGFGVSVAILVGLFFAATNYYFDGVAKITVFESGYMFGMLVAYTLGGPKL